MTSANFTPKSTGPPMMPETIAAVGPATLRLAGETCDRIRLHGFCTRRYIDEVVLHEVAVGRTRNSFAAGAVGASALQVYGSRVTESLTIRGQRTPRDVALKSKRGRCDRASPSDSGHLPTWRGPP